MAPTIGALGAILVAITVAAWAITGWVRRYALNRQMIDVPNQRSSHSAPTPRGGGLSIVLVVLAAIAFQTAWGTITLDQGLALFGGGSVVAGIGWMDDHNGLPPLWRAVAQFLAASVVLVAIGVPTELRLGTVSVPLGFLAPLLSALGMVWLTNLFNFMDGIDGFAAGEACLVAMLGGALLLVGRENGLGLTALALSAASAGFLIWNWPPARIFMGDVGSGFIGFMLGALAIAGDVAGDVPLVLWLIPLGVFIVDSTATMLRRVGRERIYEAHRRHAYQRLVRGGLSHRRVTLGAMGGTVGLSSLAALAWYVPGLTPIVVVVALALLLGTYWAVERRHPMWE